MQVDEIEYRNLINKLFGRILRSFNMIEKKNIWDQNSATYCMEYSNKHVSIQINLGMKDQALYIDILKIFSNGLKAAYSDDSTDWFFLTGLASYYEKGRNWNNEIMEIHPYYNMKSLNCMIAKSVEILEKYGSDIMNGKKWYNWKTKQIVIREDA